MGDPVDFSNPEPEQFAEINQSLWRELQFATTSLAHPWRTPVVVTASEEPSGRVVVLREVNPIQFTLTFFTDARSPKIQALTVDSRLTWVFYDPNRRLQLRIRSRSVIHRDNPVSKGHWQRLSLPQRREYATAAAPGNLLAPGSDPTASVTGEEHFAVVESNAREWDWLQLDAAGHRRIRFSPAGGFAIVP